MTPRLKDRRRQGRRRIVMLALILLIALMSLVIWGLNQPAVRISTVELKGADALLPGADPIALAKNALRGKYLGLIPRDSTFFYPAHAMRTAIIGAHPEIAAITFRHSGLTGLVMKTSMHTAVGRWCGLAPTPDVVPYCYLYDPNGFIYTALKDPLGSDVSTTSAESLPQMVNPFALYAPLEGNAQEPLRATVIEADKLPDAFAFARQVTGLGSEARTVVLRGDEADVLLASGTRLTYVLGHEQDAYSALTSAKSNLNLSNGSLDYVDLRFPGKVYLKKKGE